jgi:hypothetical protein
VISRATPEFWQLYRTLPPQIQLAAQKTYQVFLENPAHPSLRLERLRADPRTWSVRVTRDYRAVALRRGDEWLWFWIGTHRDFDRRFPA